MVFGVHAETCSKDKHKSKTKVYFLIDFSPTICLYESLTFYQTGYEKVIHKPKQQKNQTKTRIMALVCVNIIKKQHIDGFLKIGKNVQNL
jgi:hypothetical protein